MLRIFLNQLLILVLILLSCERGRSRGSELVHFLSACAKFKRDSFQVQFTNTVSLQLRMDLGSGTTIGTCHIHPAKRIHRQQHSCWQLSDLHLSVPLEITSNVTLFQS